MPIATPATPAKKEPKWVVCYRSLGRFLWKLMQLLCIAIVVSSVVGYVSAWLGRPGHVDLVLHAVPDVIMNTTSATMKGVGNNLVEIKEFVDHVSEAYK